jgi:hypothetical protein
MFISILPGFLLWVMIKYASQIKNTLIRVLVVPLIIAITVGGSMVIITSMGSMLGLYSDFNAIIEKVKITQEDLIRSEQYGMNYFYIGKIEPTPVGLLLKAPSAVIAGLFRPMIWEARNPFIVMSALENMALLLLLLYAFLRIGPIKYFRTIMRDPFLTFALLFSVIFAFGVGLASANFGALVRYKIPLLPFFVSGMFIMLGVYRKQKQMKDSEYQP